MATLIDADDIGGDDLAHLAKKEKIETLTEDCRVDSGSPLLPWCGGGRRGEGKGEAVLGW